LPPTCHPIVNRLASTIDASLVNLTQLSRQLETEQMSSIDELDRLFVNLRNYIEQRRHHYAHLIKSSYTQRDRNLHELKCRLQEIRDELVDTFTPNDRSTFDLEKYRSLELYSRQTIDGAFQQVNLRPHHRIELTNLPCLDNCFVIEIDDQLLLGEQGHPSDRTSSKRGVSIGE
jgi:hypothetical protein